MRPQCDCDEFTRDYGFLCHIDFVLAGTDTRQSTDFFSDVPKVSSGCVRTDATFIIEGTLKHSNIHIYLLIAIKKASKVAVKFGSGAMTTWNRQHTLGDIE